MKVKKLLKPPNEVVQICSDCGKVDVYLNDKHDCYNDDGYNREMTEELFYK